jgi:hypothetical protein
VPFLKKKYPFYGGYLLIGGRSRESANRNKVPTNKKQLEANTIAYMESLRNNPEKVKGFFLAESVRYAA